jgi:DNA-binding CsgD family transcriptional regulator
MRESSMQNVSAAYLDLTQIAASAAPLPQRAGDLLTVLRRVIPFDGAWLALADPDHLRYTSLAAADLDEATLTFLTGPTMARDIEVTGTHRDSTPMSPSDLPYPVTQLPTWADCLIPAGYREALAVGLFAPGGRHVGFLALLSESRDPPSADMRCQLARLTPVLTRAVDPMRSLLPAARLVQGATAGVVLRADGGRDVLPGMGDHPLLATDSPALHLARAAIAAGHVYTSFLWPLGGRHAPDGHARITALAGSEDLPAVLMGTALVSPSGNLRGLTPRELEVLGLVIGGLSNHEIARALVVAQRTVAAHLEHILAKLGAPTRTLAAVRAARHGLYVPGPPRTPPSGRRTTPR